MNENNRICILYELLVCIGSGCVRDEYARAFRHWLVVCHCVPMAHFNNGPNHNFPINLCFAYNKLIQLNGIKSILTNLFAMIRIRRKATRARIHASVQDSSTVFTHTHHMHTMNEPIDEKKGKTQHRVHSHQFINHINIQFTRSTSHSFLLSSRSSRGVTKIACVEAIV